jgi:hypothetical protein
VESNVTRRLVELGDEIKLCIELEFDYNQKVSLFIWKYSVVVTEENTDDQSDYQNV